MIGKTIKELAVNIGEQIRCVHSENSWMIGRVYTKAPHVLTHKDGGWIGFYSSSLFVRVGENPVLFGDTTPEEQGALLLATHNGEIIEYYSASGWGRVVRPNWRTAIAYRVKPKPSVEVVTKYFEQGRYALWDQPAEASTHELFYEVVDGELICDSVVITKL